jgi:uncharacterized protein (DUF1810 family)
MSTEAHDPLERFVLAQEHQYPRALAELQAGRKTTHWIWYVLPQLRGLGHSPVAQQYGLAGRAEAEAFAAHPLLGPRLVRCVQAMLGHHQRSAVQILGTVDAMKFRSCLTLFAEVAPNETGFRQALDRFYDGAPDPATLQLLGRIGHEGPQR